jgi:serine/threonine protein kinase
MGVIHRDIKGQNILLDPSGKVKLADWGSSKLVKDTAAFADQSVTASYTPSYAAPEVFRGIYNSKIDLWSLACTMIEMATGRGPWDEKKFRSQEQIHHVVSGANGKHEIPAIPAHLSAAARDFMLSCFSRNPIQRPSAADLLLHPFIISDTPAGLLESFIANREQSIKLDEEREKAARKEMQKPAYVDLGGNTDAPTVIVEEYIIEDDPDAGGGTVRLQLPEPSADPIFVQVQRQQSVPSDPVFGPDGVPVAISPAAFRRHNQRYQQAEGVFRQDETMNFQPAHQPDQAMSDLIVTSSSASTAATLSPDQLPVAQTYLFHHGTPFPSVEYHGIKKSPSESDSLCVTGENLELEQSNTQPMKDGMAMQPLIDAHKMAPFSDNEIPLSRKQTTLRGQ